MRSKVGLSICLIICFWASSFVAIKIALTDMAPVALTLGRFIISSVSLGLLAFVKKPQRIRRKDWWLLVVASLAGVTVYNLALNFGQQTVSAGSASFLINTVPVITTLLAYFFLKEKLKLRTLAGIVVSLVGVSIISLSESKGFRLNFGIMLVLLAAISQAVFFIVQKPLLKRYRPLTIISYSVWLGTLFLLPFSSGLPALGNASQNSWLALLFLGIIPGAIGHVIWSFALSKMATSRATSFLYFVPVVSLLLSFFIMQEVPSLLLILGGIVAILGVYVVNIKTQKHE